MSSGIGGGDIAAFDAIKKRIALPLFRGVYKGGARPKISLTFWCADLAQSWICKTRMGGLLRVLKCIDFAKKMELELVKDDESASTKYCVDKALGVDILGSRPSGLG